MRQILRHCFAYAAERGRGAGRGGAGGTLLYDKTTKIKVKSYVRCRRMETHKMD